MRDPLLGLAGAAALAIVTTVTAVLATPASQALAQSDVQLWTRAGIRYRADEPVRLGFDQHLRLDEGLAHVSAIMSELSVSHDPVDFLRLGLGYRFALRNSGNGLEDAHRLHVDARMRGDLGPLRLAYRLRFQERLEDEAGGLDTRHGVRNRLSVSWRTGEAVTPGVSAEVFARLGEDDAVAFTKWRLTLGASYEVGVNEIDVSYRLEMPIDDPDEAVLHIFGLGYRYTLPR